MTKREITTIKLMVEAKKVRSAWRRGVREYARELLDILGRRRDLKDICNSTLLERALLNGADSWHDYSWGGCSLVYDGDIAERLCTPSELKRTKGGERKPNSCEEWLDIQSCALLQAAKLILRCYRKMNEMQAISKQRSNKQYEKRQRHI